MKKAARHRIMADVEPERPAASLRDLKGRMKILATLGAAHHAWQETNLGKKLSGLGLVAEGLELEPAILNQVSDAEALYLAAVSGDVAGSSS